MVKPHIVLALADDLGAALSNRVCHAWAERRRHALDRFQRCGYHNPELRTPTIDGLAATGIRLDSFYTHRLCGPSRASLLTGRMPYKLEASRTNFVEFWEESGTELEYMLLPEQLRRQGYATALVGKWHQGFYHPAYLPTARGFDSFYGFLGGCEDVR